jgi:pimeloyl-ACP methyl ester carboxylesterase
MQKSWSWSAGVICLALLGITLAGCGAVEETSIELQAKILSAYEQVSVPSFANYTSQVPSTFTITAALGGTVSRDQYLSLYKTLSDGMPGKFANGLNLVKTYRVTYSVAGYSSQLTGLVAVPYKLSTSMVQNLPMISLQHPTQVLRSQSPSKVTLYTDEELTVPYGVMLASMGYIVVMPDYPGMGDNKDVHPYCMNELSQSVIGLIQASGNSKAWGATTSWNGKLFLIGFSEGGYATLVTAKEIQLHHPEINLVGVAALDGPYDLSGTMRNLMLTAPADFTAPYFLPYVVAGYGAKYGSLVSVMQFNNAVIDLPQEGGIPFDQALYGMLNGAKTPEDINTLMSQAAGYSGPKSILTQGYIDALNDTSMSNFNLYQALRENDAYRGWIPATPTKLLLYHNPTDDLVPIGNYNAAKALWGTGLPHVIYENPDEDLPGLGSVHAGTIVPAYIRAAQWVKSLTP